MHLLLHLNLQLSNINHHHLNQHHPLHPHILNLHHHLKFKTNYDFL